MVMMQFLSLTRGTRAVPKSKLTWTSIRCTTSGNLHDALSVGMNFALTIELQSSEHMIWEFFFCLETHWQADAANSWPTSDYVHRSFTTSVCKTTCNQTRKRGDNSRGSERLGPGQVGFDCRAGCGVSTWRSRVHLGMDGLECDLETINWIFL